MKLPLTSENREVLIKALLNDAVQSLKDAPGNLHDLLRSGHMGFENYTDQALIEASKEAEFEDQFAEGWGLFDYDGTGLMQIQRSDEEGIFESDADALHFVMVRAEEGSERHKQALAAHIRDAEAINAMVSA